MVLLSCKTKQLPSTEVMDNREDSSSSDEGNSVLISDGDRSRISSLPSATDMSYVVDDVNSSSQLQAMASPIKSAYPMLLPHQQLVALAEMRPPAEIPIRTRSATIDSSSVDQESLIGKPAALISGSLKSGIVDDDGSPLSYKSLEERATNDAKKLTWERSLSHGQLSSVQYHTLPFDSDRRRLQALDSKIAETSFEGEGEAQKPTTLKETQKAASPRVKQGAALRRGKWTVEEEAYVARVIQDFNSGFLDAPAGTTLRTYLSEKLKCDPMRITKKFTGDACIGKRVFHPAVRTSSNSSIIDTAQAELDTLERRWRRRLEMQQRESAKKAAASAAVAAVATSGRTDVGQPNPVAQTASWLDRAKTALQETPTENTVEALSLHYQMQEVQRLIHEGPVIQQTSADLPHMFDDEAPTTVGQEHAEIEPADKRLRTDEDAEALVGFLRSVRASAASGEEF